ncbi:ATP-binding protein [Mycobacteroides abscessus subsp. massiliense]
MRDTSAESRLCGRTQECAALDHLMTASRSGPSQVLVLRGQAGVGKTALLRYVLGKASGHWA